MAENGAIGHTPLHIASEFANFAIVQYLTAGLIEQSQDGPPYDNSVSPKNGAGRTPLHAAVIGYGGECQGRFDVLKHLLDICEDKNPSSTTPFRGCYTPLQLAIYLGHKTLKKLISDAIEQ